MTQLFLLLSFLAGSPAPPIPSGPGADAAPAIQVYIDQAQAVTDANGDAAWTTHLPQSVLPRYLGGPIYLDGRNVTLEGDGPGTYLLGGLNGYGGPAVVVGVSRLERLGVDPARYRMPSALGGGRSGVTTRGEAVLSVTAHPLQFGAGMPPDYWEGDAYTWEFVAGPGAAPWAPTRQLFGMSPGDGWPSPWAFYSGADAGSLQFWFRTAEQDPRQRRVATVPTPGPGPHRVVLQWSAVKAIVTAWVDGKAQPAAVTSTDGTPWKPGRRMARHDGVVPFTFGGAAEDPTPVEVHAFKVTLGERYGAAGPPVAGDWYDRTPGVIAFLPANDAPATHVKLMGPGPDGVGFWLTKPKDNDTHSGSLALRRLKVASRLQQAVAVGYCFGVELVDVQAGNGSLQGVGSVGFGMAYPFTIERCAFGGVDAAYYGFRQILHARNVTVNPAGRDGIRVCGGSYDWDSVTLTHFLDTTDTFFRSVGDGDGGNVSIRKLLADNESGTPRRAVLEFEQAPYCPNQILIDDVSVSTLNDGSFVRLIGHRTPATGEMYTVGKAEVKNLQVFAGTKRPVLRVDGPGSWRGRLDTTGLGTAAVAGDADGVVVTPAQQGQQGQNGP